jgi:hypothetical protein
MQIQHEIIITKDDINPTSNKQNPHVISFMIFNIKLISNEIQMCASRNTLLNSKCRCLVFLDPGFKVLKDSDIKYYINI